MEMLFVIALFLLWPATRKKASAPRSSPYLTPTTTDGWAARLGYYIGMLAMGLAGSVIATHILTHGLPEDQRTTPLMPDLARIPLWLALAGFGFAAVLSFSSSSHADAFRPRLLQDSPVPTNE